MLEVALARGRAMAERLMVDACTIQRVTGEGSDDDGNVVKTYEQLYAGRCRVQQRSGQAAQEDVGQDFQLMLRLEVHLPMSVVGLEAGDEMTVIASAHDPDLAGRTFLVRDLAHKSHATARRVGVTERTS
ncbi:DUF6093 family protein [Micromonospora sp. NBC_01655]|uniref:DUF6093 family protein n=1 Tax=Micromonospora sp. NBC_01655 TaxID=2975983 RepID=UPI0022593CC5|nr:DUF6093 family protein [Micromonospora sp. NBC_01655]MCX4470453.1 DUF6093 family protein [Micromonospora sp. NBC_01655]